MRDKLVKLVNETIIFKYDLPNGKHGIDRSTISTENDKCYRCSNKENLSTVIYNSIVDYSFNEFDINECDLNIALNKALQMKIRHEYEDSKGTQLKYGFYGEVLLYCLLHVVFNKPPLISRGYFYDPTRKSETTGYDSYHLVENDGITEMWWGEVKFHHGMESAINSATENLSKVLSAKYLKRNILAVIQHKSDLANRESILSGIIESWDKSGDIIIHDEIMKHNLKLVYPIFLIFDKNKKDTHDQARKKAIDTINAKMLKVNSDITYSLFFVLMPISYTKIVKEQVIEWIKSKEPLMS